MNIDFVILAAGKGTRMGGDSPKVLARLAGKPMLQNLINTTQNFKHSKRIIVVGYKSDLVKSTIKTTTHTTMTFCLFHFEIFPSHRISFFGVNIKSWEFSLYHA